MKEQLTYAAMLICLLILTLAPDTFWWGFVQGGAIAVFIFLIPVWVKMKETPNA